MDASEYRTDQEEQLDMTLNELFAIHEADVTGELLLKAGWSEIAEAVSYTHLTLPTICSV